uniref:Uncharacterized protein n=1 Tax=Rhizophora mucronata TaxID=61149 RepID=A0A2P2R459_RHIMU
MITLLSVQKLLQLHTTHLPPP